MMHNTRVVAVLAVTLSTVVATGDAAILRVRPGGTGDGTSWESALPAVQAALDKANPGDEVWVACGLYEENLTVPNGVSLYGGFAGTEGTRSERQAPPGQSSMLVAKQEGRVVTVPLGSLNVVLDGFTITGRPAPGEKPRRGGGISILGHATIHGNTLSELSSDGDGGAIVSVGSADVTISRNVITKNEARLRGGGIALGSGQAVLQGNTIAANAVLDPLGAVPAMGGGLYKSGGRLILLGNVITGNRVEAHTSEVCEHNICGWTAPAAFGGGIALESVTGVLSNNVIAGSLCGAFPLPGGDHEARGAGLSIRFSTLTMKGNTVASNWFFGGEARYGGSRYVLESTLIDSNNLFAFNSGEETTVDPRFVDTAGGDYHLRPDSPHIDVGSDASVTPGEVDADGNPRILGAHVDVGAYEFVPPAPFLLADVTQALRAAAGLDACTPEQKMRLDLDGSGAVDMADATAVAAAACS